MEVIYRCNKCNDFETSDIDKAVNHICIGERAEQPQGEK